MYVPSLLRKVLIFLVLQMNRIPIHFFSAANNNNSIYIYIVRKEESKRSWKNRHCRVMFSGRCRVFSAREKVLNFKILNQTLHFRLFGVRKPEVS